MATPYSCTQHTVHKAKATVSLTADLLQQHFLVLPLLLLGHSYAKLHLEQNSFGLPRDSYIPVLALDTWEGWLVSGVSTSMPESIRAGSWEEKVTESPFLKERSQWVGSSSRGKLLSSKGVQRWQSCSSLPAQVLVLENNKNSH